MSAKVQQSSPADFPEALEHKVPGTEYAITMLTEAKLHDAIAALTKAWIGFEPLATWVKATSKDVYALFTSSQEKLMKEDRVLTAIAKDSKDQVVGIALNRRYSFKVDLHAVHPAIEALLIYLESAYRDYYLANKQTGEVFCVDSLAIIDEVKGKGIGFRLVLYSLMAAKEQGYRWCIIEATNVYSRGICERFCMKKIATANYEDFAYEDKTGAKIKAFSGVDKVFTEFLNKRRPEGCKILTTAASECTLFEGDIEQMLAKIIL